VLRSSHAAASGHDQRDGSDDDGAGEHGPWLDGFAEDDRAEDHCDDRVDVGVRRHQRQRRDPDHPAECGERHDAADERQVQERGE